MVVGSGHVSLLVRCGMNARILLEQGEPCAVGRPGPDPRATLGMNCYCTRHGHRYCFFVCLCRGPLRFRHHKQLVVGHEKGDVSPEELCAS
jgi:hypothetical protein